MKIIDKRTAVKTKFKDIARGQCFLDIRDAGEIPYIKVSDDRAFDLKYEHLDPFDDDEEVIPCEAEITIY